MDRRTASDRARVVPLSPVELSRAGRVAVDVAAVSEKSILLPRGREPHVLDAYLTEHELSDAVVAAIQGDGGLAAMLLVWSLLNLESWCEQFL